MRARSSRQSKGLPSTTPIHETSSTLMGLSGLVMLNSLTQSSQTRLLFAKWNITIILKRLITDVR